MTVAIVYETVEGQTRKIAEFAAAAVRRTGRQAVMVNTAAPPAALSLDAVDKVILAAPVHERRHPKAFEAFIVAHRDRLRRLHTLMLSVSLKAAFPDGQEEAQDFLIEMEMRTGFKPDAELLVAGAVRSQSYDYYAAMIVQHVVLRGQDVQLKDGAREFTDWAALEAALAAFLAA